MPPHTRRKLYVPPESSTGTASLEVLGHGRLTMRWDPARIPYLGLWFDQCSLAHEPVIAIEPSTGYYDSLATAVRNGRVPHLKPGCPRRWSLEITIDSQRPVRTTASKSASRELG
jgi:hypothetical protein